jgi:protein involved in polysaccharide export with SLBB domain
MIFKPFPLRLFLRKTSLLFMLLCLSISICGAVPEGSYTLGAEDIITTTVIGHPEFSGDFTVTTDGVIEFPGAGPVAVSGKTLQAVSKEVTRGLSNRLRSPEVYITLKFARPQRIYVLGTVKSPGICDLKPGWRITEAISAAGGLAGGIEPADCTVKVLKAGSKVWRTAPYTSALAGNSTDNLPLDAGDVVTVEAVERIPVYIMGRVKNPGLYNLRADNTSINAALAMAGGTLENAAISQVTVTRISGEKKSINLLPVMLSGTADDSINLRSGDTVVVPELRSYVAVLGYVKDPGYFPLQDGAGLTLADAIGLAKGADNKRGGLSKVAVIRKQNGKEERLSYNFWQYLKTGDASQNPRIAPGDIVFIPETSQWDWNFVLNALTTVALWTNVLKK